MALLTKGIRGKRELHPVVVSTSYPTSPSHPHKMLLAQKKHNTKKNDNTFHRGGWGCGWLVWLVGVAALGQHIKFFEGNYCATAAVSWRAGRREVITGLSKEQGRPRSELGNLAILNVLRHVIIVCFFLRGGKKKKVDRVGAGCVYVCVRRADIMCVSLLHRSHLWPPLLRPSVRPFARRSVCPSSANKAHSHAEGMRGSTSPCHNYIWFGPPASCAHLSVAHNLSLSCGGQLEAHVSHFAPGAPRSEVFSCVRGGK